MNALYSLKAGSRLDGRYIVMDVIGEGGFGITYLGFDERLEIKVAIKEYYPQHLVARMNTYGNEVAVIKQDLHESFEKGRRRFLEEAMILGRLESEEGIVNVKDYFEENNTAYFVMEYLDGEDFETILNRDGPMDINTLIPLLEPVMKSLERVHLEGLIHRDISPDNIILTRSGMARLVDFGAARDYVGGDKSRTVILKPGYAPEEQYRSDEEQGPWTDVYALAATIYRCITGLKLPESYQRAVDDSLIRPSELGVALTPAQERALMKGLEIHVRDRYQNVSEFRLALMAPEVRESIASRQESDSYGFRYSDEESGISPVALFGAAGLFIMLAVGGGFLFHMLNGRSGATKDQIRAANEYKLTEASTQLDSAYGQKGDSDDGKESVAAGQETEDQDQSQSAEDKAAGSTGFGERWDHSGISQDDIDKDRSDDEESTEEDQPSESIEEDDSTGWTDPAEGTTADQPAEGWSDQEASSGTEDVNGPIEGPDDLQDSYSERTEKKEAVAGSREQVKEEAADASSSSENYPDTFRDNYDDKDSPEGGEKAEPIENQTGEDSSESFIVNDEDQASSPEAADNGQSASTEAADSEKGTSTETADSEKNASTEAAGDEQNIPTDNNAVESFVESGQEESETATEEVEEETTEAESATEEVVEETEKAGTVAEEAESATEEIVEETIEAESVPEEGPTGTENLEEEGQEELSSKRNEIDASQSNYEEIDGYPSYILESADQDRFKVVSLLDDQGCLKKNLITDIESGATAEVYHNSISQEDMAEGTSLRNTAFYTCVLDSRGQEYQAYFRNGKVTAFIGPDEKYQEFGEGLEYDSFLERMRESDFGDPAKLLLDVTAPGWEA